MMLSLCLGAIGVAAAPTPLWTPFEASFTSAQPVAPSPWLSVELNCTFKAAAGGEAGAWRACFDATAAAHAAQPGLAFGRGDAAAAGKLGLGLPSGWGAEGVPVAALKGFEAQASERVALFQHATGSGGEAPRDCRILLGEFAALHSAPSPAFAWRKNVGATASVSWLTAPGFSWSKPLREVYAHCARTPGITSSLETPPPPPPLVAPAAVAASGP